MEAIILIIAISIIFIILVRKIPAVKEEMLRLSADSLDLENNGNKKLNRFESLDNSKTIKDKGAVKKSRQIKSGDKEDKEDLDLQGVLEKIDELIEEKAYKEAEELLIKAVDINPTNARIYNKLGIIYLEQENFTDAKEAFKTALKYDQNNDLIYNNLGLALFNQGRYTEAIEAYQKSIQLNSLIPHRYINLGLSYAALRKYKEALDAYKKALVLDKNNKDYKKLIKEIQEKIVELKGLE